MTSPTRTTTWRNTPRGLGRQTSFRTSTSLPGAINRDMEGGRRRDDASDLVERSLLATCSSGVGIPPGLCPPFSRSVSRCCHGQRLPQLRRQTPRGSRTDSLTLCNGTTTRYSFTTSECSYSTCFTGTRSLHLMTCPLFFCSSGEFHTFRLPVPELWLDIFQKMVAVGFNGVSIYIHSQSRPCFPQQRTTDVITTGSGSD